MAIDTVEEAVAHAIRGVLTTALAGVCPVYDHQPRDAAFPFVTFDRHLAQPDDDVAEWMSEHDITLTVWSDTRGPKQVRNILGRIRKALHHAVLELEAGEAVRCVVERTDATRDADGVTYMGTAQIAVLTDNKES